MTAFAPSPTPRDPWEVTPAAPDNSAAAPSPRPSDWMPSGGLPSDLAFAKGWVEEQAPSPEPPKKTQREKDLERDKATWREIDLPAVVGLVLRARARAHDPAAAAPDAPGVAQLDVAEAQLINARLADDPTLPRWILERLTESVRDARELLATALADRGGGLPGGPRDRAHEGSMLMIAATSENNIAYEDEGYARKVAQELESPEAPLEPTMDRLAAEKFHESATAPQLPTGVRSGGRTREARPDARRKAVYVANAQYDEIVDLGSPVTDTESMKGKMAARGYENVVHPDKSGEEMGAIYDAAVADPSLQPGDSLFLYYSGHGITSGLLGVHASKRDYSTDLMPNARLNQATRAARARGIHTTVLVDACYAGAGVAEMRRLEIADLVRETRGTDLEAVTEIARQLDACKRRFGVLDLSGWVEEHAEARRKLYAADLVEAIGAHVAEFERLTGKPLVNAARLGDLATKNFFTDIIDDLTNEVLEHVEMSHLAKSDAP
jgi:Caspase domain